MVMFYTTDESGSCMPPIPCHGSFSHPVSPFLPVLFFSQTELMTITVEEQEEDLFKCARSPMANSCKMTRGDAPGWMFSFWWKKQVRIGSSSFGTWHCWCSDAIRSSQWVNHLGGFLKFGSPKSSSLMRFSIINQPFLDTPIYGTPFFGWLCRKTPRPWNPMV